MDIANYNTRTQVVLSGSVEAVEAATKVLRQEPRARCVPLRVSAAFHSRAMAGAAEAFGAFLGGVPIADPAVPVVANATARPYEPGMAKSLLTSQLRSPVKWWESMRYLLRQGVTGIEELGPGRVLTGLWNEIGRAPSPPTQAPAAGAQPTPEVAPDLELLAARLGSPAFRADYGVRYAYVAGSMYQGISSIDLVVRMAAAGLIGYFGAGGLSLAHLEETIRTIDARLEPGQSYGMNLLYPLDDPALEEATVELYLRHGVRFVEAAGYTQVTPALVRFRASGAGRDARGRPSAAHHVLAKVSRPEVARAFLQPPPADLLESLVARRLLSAEEAAAARLLPVSADVCVEADSGGHTDGGNALTLLPAMGRLREEISRQQRYHEPVRLGAAGGLGAPAAVAAAFVLGADFVVTGSVNQCSPEAATSPAVKDMLAGLDVQDTAYAPAGDMFELGARVQVVRKGTLFHARGNKLYQLYRQHSSLEEIDPETRRTLEDTYFKRPLDDVWELTKRYLAAEGRDRDIERAESNPKRKMAHVFKWYFFMTTKAAVEGVEGDRVNYQIHCGPAVGAFNRFVQGTALEDWRNRHVDVIAKVLMQGAARVLHERLQPLADADVPRAHAAQF